MTRQVLVSVYIIFSIGTVCVHAESSLQCWPAAYLSGLGVKSDFCEPESAHARAHQVGRVFLDFLLQYFPTISHLRIQVAHG